MTKEEQTLYLSGVGMLLFLIKYLRPDLSNVTRELAKCMDGAIDAAMKELFRAIKFVIDTEDYGLKIKPIMSKNEEWQLIMFTDSDLGGDKESRISITGYILYVLGVPVSWKSKSQRSVTLSSSEAEYVALSEAAKEIKFIAQIIEALGIKVKLPIIVQVNNVGAIFMTENISTSSTY